jgi:hypothetical protein
MRGEAIDHEELTRAGNSARSALTKLANKRQPLDTGPTLADIIAEQEDEAELSSRRG